MEASRVTDRWARQGLCALGLCARERQSPGGDTFPISRVLNIGGRRRCYVAYVPRLVAEHLDRLRGMRPWSEAPPRWSPS